MYYNEKFLLIDDEKGLLDLLAITLKKEHYTNITCVQNAVAALECIKLNQYDIILLDVMLPDMSGFDLCAEIRKYTYTPIIFITALDSDYNKLKGLSIGADDYISKPFNPLEVIARIHVLLRRQEYANTSPSTLNKIYNYEHFILNTVNGTLTVNNMLVECTAKEFELLTFFCKNPNKIFTISQLYESVWNSAISSNEEKTVAMYISKIRKKLPIEKEYIVNMRGMGYKFIP